ncbi:hypothetical protein [Dyella subtropica]|uniref:hypothetical protein n=1 Tax=Dyella subtropica TaxID=2992127 RepID=UPI00225B385C|nr:hypothetical protein [Dyella subtropica]
MQPSADVHHVSQQEVVAHIQALLEAKQERVRRGAGWPGASRHALPGDDLHAPVAVQGGLSSEAGYGHLHQSQERSGQGHRGKG